MMTYDEAAVRIEAYFLERQERARRELKPGDVVRLCVSKIGVEPWGDPVFMENNSKLGKIYWMNGNPPGGFTQLTAEEIKWPRGTTALVISTAGIYYRKSATGKLDGRNRPSPRVVILVNERLCAIGAENIGEVISRRIANDCQ